MFEKLAMNPAERRKWVAAASGGLIAVGLAARLGPEVASSGFFGVAALVAGSDIAWRAWRAIRVRHFGIELLVTIAAVGAFLIGDVWEAAAVTFLFALGGYLEARTLSGTRRAVASLLEVAPETANVLRGDRAVEVAAHEVEPGEVVLVKPGARVPVDGVVVHGYGAIDESTITGEATPAEKEPGATVFAGTISSGGLLRVRATGVGAETTLARVIRRVEEAQEAKAPTQRVMERFARWYTPLILGLAVFAYAATRDMHLALTLLVIACPGALVISIPVSVVAGIGRAAKEGILVKGGEHLERLGRVDTLALDKTGTLTEGRPRLAEVLVVDPDGGLLPDVCTSPGAGAALGCPEEQRDVLWTAAVAESGSEHPLGRPVLEQAAVLGAIPQPDGFEAVPGRGVRVVSGSFRIDVGSQAALEQWGIPVPAAVMERVGSASRSGATPLLIARDGVVRGLVSVQDTPRTNAAGAVRKARALGINRVVMLTGDGAAAALSAAATAGVGEVHAALLPEQKLEWVKRLQEEGRRVAMVGDGINDAPALAQADVGFAMGAAGSDVAIETADVALMTDDLEKVGRAVEISRRTVANMRQNMTFALVTVLALLTGVLMGEVHMADGMLVHELSVLAVIGNGGRLLRG